MFSLHIDTSRNWTGGSNQVMYTVMGLRARRERAALVAHPDGELFRRMSEGTDLIPLAPDHEIDLGAAWRLSRVIKQLKPDVIHAHDPLARHDGRDGAVDHRAHTEAGAGGFPPDSSSV